MINCLRNLLYNPKPMLLAAQALVSPGAKVAEAVAGLIVEFQLPLVFIYAFFLIIRVGYPLMTGDEQDSRAARKRAIPMTIGAAVIAGAISLAHYVLDFVEF